MTTVNQDQAKTIYTQEEVGNLTGQLIGRIAQIRTEALFNESALQARIDELEQQIADMMREQAEPPTMVDTPDSTP